MCTIIPRDAFGTAGRICRQSPLRSTHFPPKSSLGSLMICRSVRSTASMHYRTHIMIPPK